MDAVQVPGDSGVIGFSEKAGYALGDAASNFYWKTFEFFIVFFYTDIFGISAAAVGTMMLLTRVMDAVADPIMGAMADRTRSRWGHFRPWVVWGALPLAAAGVLTFTTPSLGGGGKLVYAYATYSLLMLLYTVVNIPYSALMGVMTPNSKERTSLASFRFIGAFTVAVLVQYCTPSLAQWFGLAPALRAQHAFWASPVDWFRWLFSKEFLALPSDLTRGWQLTMVLYGAIAVGLFLLCFLSTRERAEIRRDCLELGVSQISAGSRTNPGGYGNENEHSAQFSLGDHRSLDEVVRDLAEHGFMPSFCTGCYRLGRVGADFMDMAKPGDIKTHCQPNAISTFMEFLEDYASPETINVGLKVIGKTLEEMPDTLRRQSQKMVDQVKAGKRDVFC